MSRLRKKLKISNDPVPAIAIFTFLLGICIAIFFLKKDITDMKQYVEVIKYQIQTGDIATERVFLYILRKRLYLFAVILLISRLFGSKYLLSVLTGIFFFAYGLFVCGNIQVFGFAGFLIGFFLMIPQWAIYLSIFYLSVRESMRRKNKRTIIYLVLLFTFAGLLIIGCLVESYITLPLIKKIILKN